MPGDVTIFVIIRVMVVRVQSRGRPFYAADLEHEFVVLVVDRVVQVGKQVPVDESVGQVWHFWGCISRRVMLTLFITRLMR